MTWVSVQGALGGSCTQVSGWGPESGHGLSDLSPVQGSSPHSQLASCFPLGLSFLITNLGKALSGLLEY